ncbi:MAG: Basic amino-acid permease [Bathelium mastoideum]|nr:MAG: Basic amino-acid permease [Bathelium mastoideum]
MPFKNGTTYVVINGDTYILPRSTIDLPQPDGSMMTLAPSLVAIGNESFNIPPVLQPASIKSPGSTSSIIAMPMPRRKPVTDGLTGAQGLLKALSHVATDASEASHALDDFMTKGTQWATSNMTSAASELASTINGPLSDGLSHLQSLSSSMAGISVDTNISASSLPSDGRRVFMALDVSLDTTFDWMQTVNSLIRSLSSMNQQRSQHIRQILTQIFQGPENHPLKLGLAALEEFSRYDWNDEQLPLTPVQSSTNPESMTPFASMTSEPLTGTTSNLAKRLQSTEKRKPYLLANKSPSTRKEFAALVKELPKRGPESQTLGGVYNPDAYMTFLTDVEAEKIRKREFVAYALDVSGPPDKRVKSGVTLGSTKSSKRRTQKREDRNTHDPLIQFRQPSVEHLKLISENPTQRSPNLPYFFNPTLGRTKTIYVVDSGCNTAHTELSNSGRAERARGWPEQGDAFSRDTDGHGTKMASVAAGKTLGVASKANLVCVNMDANFGPQYGNVEVLQFGFNWLLNDIRTKNLQGRAVIAYAESWPITHSPDGRIVYPRAHTVFEYFLPLFEAQQVPFVVAAGNDGGDWFDPATGETSARPASAASIPAALDQFVPQLFGPRPGMFTVGGVWNDGKLWSSTTPHNYVQHKPGMMDVYAQSDEVEVAVAESDHATVSDEGTSFAAAAIAGLIAYILGVDELRLELFRTPGGFMPALKRKLANVPRESAPDSFAYQRAIGGFLPDDDPINDLNYRHLGFPRSLPVGYNQIWTHYRAPAQAAPAQAAHKVKARSRSDSTPVDD